MSEDERKKLEGLSFSARASILEAIRQSVDSEKTANLGTVGSVVSAIDVAADTNLYSKGPVGDNYAKNSKLMAFDDLVRPAISAEVLSAGGKTTRG